MLATWIEAAAKGRHGGPVRAGMWSTVIIGTHPIQADQEVWLELASDDTPIGPLPAFWVENKGGNSHWHVPVPPQAVNARMHYRSWARCGEGLASSGSQDSMVRPNVPEAADPREVATPGPEGLVGNRSMTARVDERGATVDVYFPTVGLHSDVRPAEGERPRSRSHFRSIAAGLAIGHRIDWFGERQAWNAFQHYQGATNLLMTELSWRRGGVRVLATDFMVQGDDLPRTATGDRSPAQYFKRFRIVNDGDRPIDALFGLAISAEVNGGIGETGLSWRDEDRTLLAINRGHGHVNRKLARDSTVEFAIALDDRGEVQCEPTGPTEAILLRPVRLEAGRAVAVDVLISGAFTGWRGDSGTFEHWLSPALRWFRSADLDAIEQATAKSWDRFVEPLPSLHFPRPNYAVGFRRSSLAVALHADEQHGAIASGFDRGLNAYCWPREAVLIGDLIGRAGHPEINSAVYRWLGRAQGHTRSYPYWFQKYTIDGVPEWETPAVDQSALIPWGIERHYRRTGDLDFVAASWPMIDRAARACRAESKHPGLAWIDPLHLVSSVGIWGHRYGAFLSSNAAVVAGLGAASRLAGLVGRPEASTTWRNLAERIWAQGVLGESAPGDDGPGLVDHASGRFLEARRLSTLRDCWTDRAELLVDRSSAIDVALLSPCVPFGLLAASDPRVRASAEAIARHNAIAGDAHFLARWTAEPDRKSSSSADVHAHDLSCLATLWFATYLIRLGRETGDPRHWTQAVATLDAVLARLGPLGLAIRPSPRGGDSARPGVGTTTGAWALQSMLVDAMLDVAGLGYDAPDRILTLDPVLPPSWPHVGLTQRFACGEVSYRLERPIGSAVYRLSVRAELDHPATLKVGVTCPGLASIGAWSAEPEAPSPGFDHAVGRLDWSASLPRGSSTRAWTWG